MDSVSFSIRVSRQSPCVSYGVPRITIMETIRVLEIIVPVLLWFISSTWGAPSGVSDLNIPLIEAEALKLSLEDFEGDPVFQQTIVDSKTEYHLLRDGVVENVNPTYETDCDDTGKEIVVLPPSASHSQFTSGNTYVVLRKKADNAYYGTYAYAR